MRRYTNINYYALLGVMSDAPREEIRAAYRAKVRVAHPDHGGDPELFAQIAEAWEVLGNENERAIYDADHKLRMRTNRPYQTTRLSREDIDAAKSEFSDPADRFAPKATTTTDKTAAREEWMKNKRRL